MVSSSDSLLVQERRRFTWRWEIGAVLAWSLVLAPHARADNLDKFITDLYGGTGTVLLPLAPDVPEPIAAALSVQFFAGNQFEQLVGALNESVLLGTGVFSLNSSVTGISFDLSQGIPVMVEDSLGPVLTERAKTLGDNRLSLSFSYSSQRYDELDGRSLNDTVLLIDHFDCCQVGPPPIPPPDGQLTGFELDQIQLNIDIDLKQEVYAFLADYGLTSNLDVGLVVPIVSVEARAFSSAEVIVAGPGSLINGSPVHSFEGNPDARFSNTGGSATGLGDVIVRGKYRLMNENSAPMSVALLGQVALPTGDEHDLLGTGETRFKAMLVASRTLGRVSPLLNLSWEQATSQSSLENFSYAVGLDAKLTNRWTAELAVMGRYSPHLDEIGNHTVDGAFAVKFNPFSDRNAPISTFVRIPLNDDGLRADAIWGVGFSYIIN